MGKAPAEKRPRLNFRSGPRFHKSVKALRFVAEEACDENAELTPVR
jgi:hypothetical protein